MPTDNPTARPVWHWRQGDYSPFCPRTAKHWREAELDSAEGIFIIEADFKRTDGKTVELDTFRMMADRGRFIWSHDEGASIAAMVAIAEAYERMAPR